MATSKAFDRAWDVLVVGAGPAGIAASVTAAEAGRSVGLIDDNPNTGGQIWRHRSRAYVPGEAQRWLDRLTALSTRITHLHESRVVASLGTNHLLVQSPGGPIRASAKSIVLATGARELFLPFPGWTLPGVVGVGGMQALMKSGLSVGRKRVVVAGTGPLLLAVAQLLKASGAQVPAIVEQASAGAMYRFAASLWRTPGKFVAGAALKASLWNVRSLTSSYVVRAERTAAGALRVEVATPRGPTTIECDLLACGYHLIPNVELPRLLGCTIDEGGQVRVDSTMQTTVPGVYAVGELTGVGGAEKAVLEGRIAGHAASRDDTTARRLCASRAAHLDFARRLDATFALRSELRALAEPETILCRCEDVRLGDLTSARDARDAKLQTRCGMGPCQGRICGPILERLRGFEPPGVRPPVLPCDVGTLARAGASPATSAS
jgi:NADPH-dependent 2,4-dienoyl-CoA reductase/sulfur reductase-like enzyme